MGFTSTMSGPQAIDKLRNFAKYKLHGAYINMCMYVLYIYTHVYLYVYNNAHTHIYIYNYIHTCNCLYIHI